MAERRSFLLRIDPAILDAVQRWANDDLRSLNGQIEFLLRRSLEDSGRGPRRDRNGRTDPGARTGDQPDGRVGDE
jgi:hypothetical protein